MIKNKKFSITLTLLLVLITLATSFLFLVPKRENALHADTVDTSYIFSGSDFFTFSVMANDTKGSSSARWARPVILTVSFDISTFGSFYNFYCSSTAYYYRTTNFDYEIVPYTLRYFESKAIISSGDWQNQNFLIGSNSNINTNAFSLVGTEEFYGVDLSVVTSPNFTANINRVEIGIRNTSLTNFFDRVVRDSNDTVIWCNYLYLRYYDINNEYIDFEFLTLPDFDYETRTYYFVNPNNFTDNESFQSGFDQGYNEGLGVGNSEGYDKGYSAGNAIGYNNGYSAGVEASNQYTFLSLMGSVLDAPLKTFTSLLNFNLLGVNILSFITGLLTLAIIVFVAKLILGGK